MVCVMFAGEVFFFSRSLVVWCFAMCGCQSCFVVSDLVLIWCCCVVLLLWCVVLRWCACVVFCLAVAVGV